MRCETCLERNCGHEAGQRGCCHYMCGGDIPRGQRWTCPGVEAGKARVAAIADAIRGAILPDLSPESAAFIRAGHRGELGADALASPRLGQSLAEIADMTAPGTAGWARLATALRKAVEET